MEVSVGFFLGSFSSIFLLLGKEAQLELKPSQAAVISLITGYSGWALTCMLWEGGRGGGRGRERGGLTGGVWSF